MGSIHSCMILSALRSSFMHSLIYMFVSKPIPLALRLHWFRWSLLPIILRFVPMFDRGDAMLQHVRYLTLTLSNISILLHIFRNRETLRNENPHKTEQ